MTCVFNGTKFLTLVISLVEEHEVAMAAAFRPVCFLNFELFLFIVKELTVSYFQVFNERIVQLQQPQQSYKLSLHGFRRQAVERKARNEQVLQSLFTHMHVQRPCKLIGTKQSVYLREEHNATMQPRFDRCVFQNLNFPVFDETENCQFYIFRLLMKR